MYLPAVCGVGYYFERKRALATGIAVCGTGIGTMAMAPFAKYMLNVMDWKNSHYIFGKIFPCKIKSVKFIKNNLCGSKSHCLYLTFGY